MKKTLFSLLFILFCAVFACQDQPYIVGQRLYKANCSNCHLDDGKGLGDLIPPLAGADYLEKNRLDLPCLLRNGTTDTIVVNGKQFVEKMPGVPHLSEADVTNILNYINNNWGNNYTVYRLDEVIEILKKCPKRTNSEF